MTDIKLDATGDIDITDGSASLVTDPLEALVQRLTIRLRFFQGEWFLDLLFGVPYHGRVLIRGANEADMIQIFQFAIESMPGIQAVETLDIDFDGRKVNITGSALGDTGELVSINTEVPIAA